MSLYDDYWRALDENERLRDLCREVWDYGNMSPLPNGLMERIATALGIEPS